MEIFVAESAGYCFGVHRAIEKVENSVDKYKKPIYTLGPIIHNKQVIEKLEEKGIYSINDVEEVKDGVIVIRSHGVKAKILDKIKNKQLDIVNSTCPYVKNIQDKVQKYYKEGYQIIIVGNKEHPEVVGVNGWCEDSAIIVNSVEETQEIHYYKKICIVAQTTIIQDNFSKVVTNIIPKSKELIIFNTICNATIERQEDAKELSKIVDAMIVIGGYHSSNTQKLVSICREYCKNTYHIETYEGLPLEEVKKHTKVGITAGASTPAWIIKEVIEKMEKNVKDNNEEQMNFEENFESTMLQVKTGDILVGKVVSVNSDEVIVNIGYKSDGIISKKEYVKEDQSLEEIAKIGDEVQVMVLSLNDGDGNVVLSKKRVEDKQAEEKIKSAYQNEEILKGKIIKSIKGGFMVDLGYKDVFMPISQYHVRFIKNLESVVGEDVIGKIIEYNPSKNRVIFSQRIVLEKEIADKKEQIFSSLEVGKTTTGIVKTIVKFGVFIDLGGVDGFIHISDLAWERVNNPKEILNIGDTIEAKVTEIDKAEEKIKLSLKHLVEEPWTKVFRIHNIGDKVKVKVVKIAPFGAFAQIIPGVEGLIHKSQISFDEVEKVENFLSIGQEIEVQIISMEQNTRKIGLSIIALQDKPIKKIEKNETIYEEEGDLTLGDIFGDLFNKDN